MNSPNFMTSVNNTAKKRFMPQVVRAEVHVANARRNSPKTLAFFAIDLDEERMDTLGLRSVATPESIRRDCR
jgi:hypothetical protein